jgi:hypothetical protein
MALEKNTEKTSTSVIFFEPFCSDTFNTKKVIFPICQNVFIFPCYQYSRIPIIVLSVNKIQFLNVLATLTLH